MTREILVIGGAGYVGSHAVEALRAEGYVPVVLDNLSGGYREAVGKAELIVGDMGDAALLDMLFSRRQFAGVLHFASLIDVAASQKDPARYYSNNVAATLVLLESMRKHGVAHLVFSSSAAVYGEPEHSPVTEDAARKPVSVYGQTKCMVEDMLAAHHKAYGLHYTSLRYFNAAGAHPNGSIGECHPEETHLIPLVLQAASGRRRSVSVFGNQYPTEDGTCIRDYVHVCDLAAAHVKALESLWNGSASRCYNLGTGKGYSVLEVIRTAERVTGKTIKTDMEKRRDGDPAVLVADGSLAREKLGWVPAYPELETMLQHAWAWESRMAESIRSREVV